MVLIPKACSSTKENVSHNAAEQPGCHMPASASWMTSNDMIKPNKIASDSPLKKWWQLFFFGISPLSRTYLNEASHGSHWRWHRNQTRLKPWIKPPVWSNLRQLLHKFPKMHIQCIQCILTVAVCWTLWIQAIQNTALQVAKEPEWHARHRWEISLGVVPWHQMWHTLDPHETIWTEDGTHIICACWCKLYNRQYW